MQIQPLLPLGIVPHARIVLVMQPIESARHHGIQITLLVVVEYVLLDVLRVFQELADVRAGTLAIR